MTGQRRLDGKIILVTGAGAGVGRAVVRELARQGATVALLGRGEERLLDAKVEVEAAGGRALVIASDVADADAVEQAADRTERELGPIDVWINNAMTTIFSPVREIAPDEFRRATEVTYLGAVWGTMAALRRMRARNRGTIVQVGSALAYRAIPLQAPYCGAKHALRGFTDALRSELIHEASRIKITMVHLPGLNTPQFSWCETRLPGHPQPVPPIYQPEVAARAIVWAAAFPRREYFVGWPTVKTVWGGKLVPGYLDRYLARHVVDGQQTSTPVSRERPSNLFAPVPGRYAAHGVFNRRATSRSPLSWLARHRRAVALTASAATLLVGAGVVVARLRRR